MVCNHAHSVISFVTICARPWEKRLSPLALMHVHHDMVMGISFGESAQCFAFATLHERQLEMVIFLIWCVIGGNSLLNLRPPNMSRATCGLTIFKRQQNTIL